MTHVLLAAEIALPHASLLSSSVRRIKRLKAVSPASVIISHIIYHIIAAQYRSLPHCRDAPFLLFCFAAGSNVGLVHGLL